MTAQSAQIRREFEHCVSLVRSGNYAEAQPLLERTDFLERFPLAKRIREFVRFRLAGTSLATVTHLGETATFRVSDRNLGMDIFHAAGEFFEIEELEYCRQRVSPGGVIVDVGANVGNHSVFFGRFLKPSRLIPVEPNSEALPFLMENLTLNDIDTDERGFGIALGRASGQGGITSDKGDLVESRMASGTGIPVVALDTLVEGPVHFLKIDVEGMEFEVLRGAQQIIARSRPHILIEVADAKADALKQACADLNYRIDREFEGYRYRNYFLSPV
ncbi:FkbM family methyltransferase [Nisaea acidiphila]|uniref:FkbM family methyltransferase n=1 Tax=Nisaea acidiphila TaxID=1862145 RepID=A0A9J7AN70_9PROT|nr:FkbM family methyltransferase [Nisaea acidiphila]UUX48025.1 FkbM family methyltransferase [Nisaea acidiphila]